MRCFTILALTTIAAFTANFDAAYAANAKAQGNRPSTSQIAGKSVLFRLVVDQGESAILRQAASSEAEMSLDAIRNTLPTIADDR